MTKDEQIEQLERHLNIMVATADDLLERLINATEDFEEDERIGDEELEETREQIEDARQALFKSE